MRAPLLLAAGLALAACGDNLEPPPRRVTFETTVGADGLSPALAVEIPADTRSHSLALQHLRNVGSSGMTYDDPLDDTVPGTDNLMASGTALTPHQAFALSRSALLVAE